MGSDAEVGGSGKSSLGGALPTRSGKGGVDGADSLAEASRANLAALAAANAAWVDGLERIGMEMIGLTRQTLQATAATGTALINAGSIADVVQVAGEFAKEATEYTTSGAARLLELGLKVAGEVSAPIAARVEQALDEIAAARAE